MQKIDVLMPPAHRCGYGVLPHFSRCFLAALQRCGVQCRLLGSEEGADPHLISVLLRDPPDFTLSFNGLLPDETGEFFCERLQIPHIACLVDSPNRFLSMITSKLNIVTCIDQDWANFFLGLGHANTFFMPHAVDKDFYGDLDAPRPYDVVFTGTCIDIDEIRGTWKDLFTQPVCEVMDAAAEIALADQHTSYLEAFNLAMKDRLSVRQDIDPATLDLPDVLDNLEGFIRGKDRIELLRAIRDVKIHLYGINSGAHGWDYYLKGASKNLIDHGRMPYLETLELIKKSRVVMNSCPSIKAGAHERIFSGYLGGAAILTNDNPYIRGLFEPDKEILLYRHDSYDAVNQQLLDLLNDEPRRREMVLSARKKVLAHHTWDQRAQTLLSHLKGIALPF